MKNSKINKNCFKLKALKINKSCFKFKELKLLKHKKGKF